MRNAVFGIALIMLLTACGSDSSSPKYVLQLKSDSADRARLVEVVDELAALLELELKDASQGVTQLQQEPEIARFYQSDSTTIALVGLGEPRDALRLEYYELLEASEGEQAARFCDLLTRVVSGHSDISVAPQREKGC